MEGGGRALGAAASTGQDEPRTESPAQTAICAYREDGLGHAGQKLPEAGLCI